MNDEIYMNEALKIAANARGRTSPNPLVGAVIVKNNRIIAEGWHRQAGTPHAEINALNMAGDLAKDSTLYVTLEPCSHFGRTPPCANAIVNAGIKKVVIAMTDPNPKVAGRGIEILKNAGIEVEVGILEDQARRLNEVFIKWITTQKPFVTLKTAMSLDGKIATATGQSQWITSEESRRKVHELRDINDAIMIGIGTVLADNPSLTTRIDGGKNPIRIIVDSQLRTPINANVIVDGQAKTIIATTKNAPINKVDALKKSGVEIIFCGDDRRVDLNILMNELASREITSIFVEGGGTLNFSLLENHLVDKVFAFIAPKIIGGREALTSVEGDGFSDLNKAINLKNITTEMIGEDILISGIVCNDN
ncbi:MAG: bifunctional diaminohydroxyphosphoribosylaminopyrimidine deaminase/5-amino-6-(5-phosphoribosylamino)uracil reductase RibD [Selenomonadaceae bacterium]|nr:bifunctional diaminohydroxyphosphoribosylaminopyrimidine deaminase/5-amino-6-(5-phosphoribosylamino)uracil reductase RibD [Selenomonadaceae bacterium]